MIGQVDAGVVVAIAGCVGECWNDRAVASIAFDGRTKFLVTSRVGESMLAPEAWFSHSRVRTHHADADSVPRRRHVVTNGPDRHVAVAVA
jgi:hypothetical protein